MMTIEISKHLKKTKYTEQGIVAATMITKIIK